MDFKTLMRPYQEEALENLRKWVQIPSVHDEATIQEGKPFGNDIASALDFIARLAESKGFEVNRCDGYCTEIICGTGDKIIGIYAHSDVVPVSGDWKYPPFSATLADDVLYGRGTSDDKGPAMAAFYSLVALKENHLIDGYQVRLVIGGNEEKGSACLEHYFHVLKKPNPTYGFTPDGDFPLIYGEKGITNYRTSGELKVKEVKKIHAGVVSNSVIDLADAIVTKKEPIEAYLQNKKFQYEWKEEEDGLHFILHGKAAHGSLPELGINAGIQMLDVLGHAYHVDEWIRLADAYQDPSGKTMDEFYHSDLLKDTTYNVGIIEYENNQFSMIVNFRYPEQVKPLAVITNLNAKLPFYTEIISTSETLFFDPNCAMIQNLLRVYQEETGDLETPIKTIGGGTYAKECKNTVAFGSAFPHSDDHIHEANEHITLKDFYQSMPIYAHAIYCLGKETCE